MDKIFIVEDEENIRELIAYALNNNGFKAVDFSNAKGLYKALEEEIPALFVLDIMLDDEDGYTILKKLKSNWTTEEVPVIMLTAKTDEFDKVKGLDMGADDYITKPFGVMELLSRIKAVLRRIPQREEKTDTVVHFENIHMDLEKRTVTVGTEPVVLTYKEFELLNYLIMNKGIVLTRDKIMNEIWGFEYQGESRTVDVHIRTLRQKLGAGGKKIVTVRNVGYKIGG